MDYVNDFDYDLDNTLLAFFNANKIIELINSKENYERISKNCIAFAFKYDIKNYVSKLLKLYI